MPLHKTCDHDSPQICFSNIHFHHLVDNVALGNPMKRLVPTHPKHTAGFRLMILDHSCPSPQGLTAAFTARFSQCLWLSCSNTCKDLTISLHPETVHYTPFPWKPSVSHSQILAEDQQITRVAFLHCLCPASANKCCKPTAWASTLSSENNFLPTKAV